MTRSREKNGRITTVVNCALGLTQQRIKNETTLNKNVECDFERCNGNSTTRDKISLTWVINDKSLFRSLRLDKILYEPSPPVIPTTLWSAVLAENAMVRLSTQPFAWMKDSENGAQDIDVRVDYIAAARPSSAPLRKQSMPVGNGRRVEGLLCANVGDSSALCHKGTLKKRKRKEIHKTNQQTRANTTLQLMLILGLHATHVFYDNIIII